MKRILMVLTVAALLVVAMSVAAVSAFADPNCAKVGGNNQNCVTTVTGPGNSETTPAAKHNPNVKTQTTFHGRPQ